MKHEQRNTGARHEGGRALTGGDSVRWTTDGTYAGVSPSVRPSRGYASLPGGEAEEVGLSLVPPSRYRSLLVPLDSSAFGEHALPLALGIARRAGASIRLVYVHSPLESAWGPDRLYPDSGLDGWLKQRKQAYLDGLMRRLARVTPVQVTSVLLEGRDVAVSLCEAAGAGTDLVVMATHGRGMLGRLWSGSVADALMRRLSVPLLLTRGYNAPADLTGDPLMRHVLVPLDGSELAEQALEPALALGDLTGADHTLLRVVPSVTDYSLGYAATGSQRPLADSQQAEAWDYLRRTAERLGERTLRPHPRIVHDERPVAGAILHYARTRDVDLIALATRGRGGLARLLRGSVADRVVRGASVPVLVYRPDTEQGGMASP